MIANRDNELEATERKVDDQQAQGDRHTVVGIFPDTGTLEAAHARLLDVGFAEEYIAVVGRGTDAADEIRNQEASDHATKLAAGGAAAGGVSGAAIALLAGATTLAIPGIGPVLVAVGGALVGAAAGGWLGSLGISTSEDVEERYRNFLEKGNYLLFVRTDDIDQNQRARTTLHEAGATGIENFPYAVNPADVSERPGSNPEQNP